MDVEDLRLDLGDDVLDGARPGRVGGRSDGRFLLPARRQERQPHPDSGDGLLVVLDEHVRQPGDGGVHLGTPHLLEGDVLAGDHLRQSRGAEVGGGVAADHDGQVAQGGHIGGAGGGGPEQGADLGDPPGDLDLVVEDVAPGAAADEALELFVDAGAGGVEQVHDRGAGRVGEFLGAGDLLEGPLAPGAGLDGVVVGDDDDVAAVDLADGGDHGVAGQALVEAGEQAVLEAPAVVEEQFEAVADQHLAGLDLLAAVLLRAAEPGRGQPRLQLLVRAAGGGGGGGGVEDVGHGVLQLHCWKRDYL